MYQPGAKRSTVVAPQHEKLAMPSVFVDAPTLTTFGSGRLAGYVGRRSLSLAALPAAATNSTPLAWALLTAFSTSTDGGSPGFCPHEALITLAPLSAA